MVHRHLGAEHISAGEYDVPPSSPTKTLPSSGITIDRGLQCDTTGLSSQQKASYTWEHCVDMEVSFRKALAMLDLAQLLIIVALFLRNLKGW
jgi:hypothetical protein